MKQEVDKSVYSMSKWLNHNRHTMLLTEEKTTLSDAYKSLGNVDGIKKRKHWNVICKGHVEDGLKGI